MSGAASNFGNADVTT